MQLTARRREALTSLLFVAPELLSFLVFVHGPLAAILIPGLFDGKIVVGTFRVHRAGRSQQALDSEEVARVARTTTDFGLGFVPTTVILGRDLAIAVDFRTRSIILRSAYFQPVVINLAEGPRSASSQGLGSSPWPRVRSKARSWAAL